MSSDRLKATRKLRSNSNGWNCECRVVDFNSSADRVECFELKSTSANRPTNIYTFFLIYIPYYSNRNQCSFLLFISQNSVNNCAEKPFTSIYDRVPCWSGHFTLSFLSRIPHCNANQFSESDHRQQQDLWMERQRFGCPFLLCFALAKCSKIFSWTQITTTIWQVNRMHDFMSSAYQNFRVHCKNQ